MDAGGFSVFCLFSVYESGTNLKFVYD